MNNTPSDAELETLIATNRLVVDGGQCAFESWADIRPELVKFARAVLAKWGTPQQEVRDSLTCEWTHNDDDGYWDTSCGKAWRFDDGGGPKENNMSFCHCCGKTLRIKGGQHGTE